MNELIREMTGEPIALLPEYAVTAFCDGLALRRLFGGHANDAYRISRFDCDKPAL